MTPRRGGGGRTPGRVPFVHHRDCRRTIPGIPLHPLRGERILAYLLEEGWIRPRHVVEPRPASLEHLQRVHAPAYLRSLDEAATVSRILGAPMRPEEERRAVELQRLVAGGTIRASRLALRRRGPAVHLHGGLHHAGPDRGGGFCILNDVAVAVGHLRGCGFPGAILVVDLDLHDGEGTRAAFRSSHFHVAVLARRHLRFLRPEDEVRFEAIRKAVRDLPLAEASGAVEAGRVRDEETGEALRWRDVPMVVPVGERLKGSSGE